MTRKKRHNESAEAATPKATPEAFTPDVDAPVEAPGSEPEPQPAATPAPAAAAKEQESPNDRYMRLRADFENFRSRTLRERTELYRRANEDLLTELLPVLDHMELALQAAEQHRNDHDPDALIEGFGLVRDQMLTALGKFGLVSVDAEGQDFDPNVHEAISHLASQDIPEDRVIAQIRRGYKLGDRLLRATQVAVSSGASEPAETDTSEG